MTRVLARACVALAVANLAGCALMTPANIETRKEVLNQLPTDVPQASPHSATLLVLAPQADRLYDTTRMAYAIQPYQVEYFSMNEWGEKPSEMMQRLIVATLEKTRFFSAIVAAPDFGHHTHALRTEILELKQDFTSEPPMLHLALRVQLSGEATNRAIATKEISIREPMREKTPYAGVVAANEAVAKALAQVARFVVEKAG